MSGTTFIRARDNALLKELRKLASDNTAYRKAGRYWVEGDHLCRAALVRKVQPEVAVFSETFWAEASEQWAGCAARIAVVADSLFGELSALESPAKVGFVLALGQQCEVLPKVNSVILDRVQDAGNVGSILRSAAAFGFKQVLALKGSAALWSPKVLRAGMGAHFGLNLIEGLAVDSVGALEIPLVVTSSHQGQWVQNLRFSGPCAWVLGHEGQGVSPELFARATHFARIDQPGGEESLNVAAAAAICLHASSLRPL
jgi:TrmH family RNA methyltransferase